MPEDVVAALTEDELIDLVAYLVTLKTPALTPEAFRRRRAVPGEEHGDGARHEVRPGEGRVRPEGDVPGTATGRQSPGRRSARTGRGTSTSRPCTATRPNNSASYMYAEIESPAEQDAEVLLGTDDGARLWVNGKEVFTTRETQAAAPEQHKVAVKLLKGKNAVLLKVANGNNPHGFYFSLTSAEETKARREELRQAR